MARAKNISDSSNNNARLKVVFFEAENISSDLTGVINAFANAIRAAPIQLIAQQSPPALIDSEKAITGNNAKQLLTRSDDEDNTIESTLTPTSLEKKRPRERKPFKGTILDTINWEGGGTPFVEYIKQKNPQDTAKKYLVIAAWFKRHGGYDAVTANLMYNAYRKMGWVALADMSQSLRNGADSDRGYFHSEGKGNYAITNIGLDAADKVGSDKSVNES